MTSIIVIILLAPVLFAAVQTDPPATRLAGAHRTGDRSDRRVLRRAHHRDGRLAQTRAVVARRQPTISIFRWRRVLYEFRKDVVTCLLIGGAHVADRQPPRRSGRPRKRRRATASEALPHMVWLRDGTTRIRIEPREMIWISSAGNYVEYSLADGRNHLVRGTLAADGNRACTVQPRARPPHPAGQSRPGDRGGVEAIRGFRADASIPARRRKAAGATATPSLDRSAASAEAGRNLQNPSNTYPVTLNPALGVTSGA